MKKKKKKKEKKNKAMWRLCCVRFGLWSIVVKGALTSSIAKTPRVALEVRNQVAFLSSIRKETAFQDVFVGNERLCQVSSRVAFVLSRSFVTTSVNRFFSNDEQKQVYKKQKTKKNKKQKTKQNKTKQNKTKQNKTKQTKTKTKTTTKTTTTTTKNCYHVVTNLKQQNKTINTKQVIMNRS